MRYYYTPSNCSKHKNLAVLAVGEDGNSPSLIYAIQGSINYCYLGKKVQALSSKFENVHTIWPRNSIHSIYWLENLCTCAPGDRQESSKQHRL